MKMSELLLTARDVVVDGWTRGAVARTSKGWPTNADNPDATTFCSIGALQKAILLSNDHLDDTELWLGKGPWATRQKKDMKFWSVDRTTHFIEEMILRKKYHSRADGIASWNDYGCRKKEDVIQMFDDAAKEAKDLGM